MRAILHIGSPKAGSSAIQTAFWRQREALTALGLAYHPNPRALSTLYEALPSVPAALRSQFDTVDEARNWSAHKWTAFERAVADQQAEVTLLSSEHFLNLPDVDAFITRLRGLFSTIDVIAYVRDPVSLFPSSVDQKIRAGARARDLFSDWDLANPMWAAAALDRYRAVVGDAHLHVRNFERANLRDGDIVADIFARISSLTGRAVAPPDTPIRSNESFPGAAAAWFLVANEYMGGAARSKQAASQRQAMIKRIREARHLHALPKLKLEDDQIIHFLRHQSRSQCAHLNQTYLHDQVPLQVGATLDTLPPVQELRARARAWIMSYLSPVAAELLASELIGLE